MRITTALPASAAASASASEGEAPARPGSAGGVAKSDDEANDKDDAPPPASSGSASSGSVSKPKRPLSGYNLFYRYKRLKVLEATSKARGDRPPPPDGAEDPDDADLIREVLTALPGLECLPPSSPLWGLPRPDLDDARCANIRRDMEGKLFPNENARQRLHRKVHGMGFVEMGKTMRDMWARIDATTKEVFCELADVGRVRYRMLLAEYRAVQAASGGGKKEGKRGHEKGKSPAKTAKKGKQAKTMAAAAAPSKAAADKPGAVLPGLVHQGQLRNPVHRRDSVLSAQSLQPLAVHSVPTMHPQMMNGTAIGAMISVPTSTGSEDAARSYGRRVSDNSLSLCLPTGGAEGGSLRRASTDSLATVNPGLDMTMAGGGRRSSTVTMDSLPLPSRRASTDSMSSLGMSALNLANRRGSVDSIPPEVAGEFQELQELQQFLLRNAAQNSAQRVNSGNSAEVNEALQVQFSMLQELQQLRELQDLQRRQELHQQQQQARGGNGSASSGMNASSSSMNASGLLQGNNSSSSGMNASGLPQGNNSSSSGMNAGGLLPPSLFRSTPPQQQPPAFAGAASASLWESLLPKGTGGEDFAPGTVNKGGTSPASDAQSKEDVSAQDFMDFIGQLDEAIDHDCQRIGTRIEGAVGAAAHHGRGRSAVRCKQGPNVVPSNQGQGQDRGPGMAPPKGGGGGGFRQSFIFGNPIHDVPQRNKGRKPGGGSAASVPMPAAYALNCDRARMA